MKITKDDVGKRVYSITFGFGVISTVGASRNIFPVTVRFDNDRSDIYTSDGKLTPRAVNKDLYWNEIEIKEIKMKTVEIERWINVYKDSISYNYKTKDDANQMAAEDRIACIKLTGSYQVREAGDDV